MEYILTVSKFREALREGKFLGLRCNQCGTYTVPPKKVCSKCQGEDMEIAELSRNGEIQTFTVIHVTPEGFPSPLIVILVKLEEGPWITANLVNFDPDKATMDLIGRKGKVGYQDLPEALFSAGEQLALTFTLS